MCKSCKCRGPGKRAAPIYYKYIYIFIFWYHIYIYIYIDIIIVYPNKRSQVEQAKGPQRLTLFDQGIVLGAATFERATGGPLDLEGLDHGEGIYNDLVHLKIAPAKREDEAELGQLIIFRLQRLSVWFAIVPSLKLTFLL